ncbi:SCAN domain-containing protein 3-like [Aphis craccivora]|uniref:SCAN domain-containing protein 3-like n=1 Tax=Aphis craccivora TaxID=307492 RepID=A0A6G0YI14_APHCR|nr:SCAN domain-containing protein 3-like [Aphis craccivora]
MPSALCSLTSMPRLDILLRLINLASVTDDGYYQLGTMEELLKSLYSRSEFTICQKNLIVIKEVPRKNTYALRTIATQQFTGTGQGFIKYTFKTNVSQINLHQLYAAVNKQ